MVTMHVRNKDVVDLTPFNLVLRQLQLGAFTAIYEVIFIGSLQHL